MKSIKSLIVALWYLSCINCIEPWHETLLIINYNHPHYDSIPFLKELYGNHFPHIVFYGPANHPDVNQISHHRGFFAYMAIADAMERYPKFAGYFYIHDDVVIHPWNLRRYDRSKIWCQDTSCFEVINAAKVLAGTSWGWWKTKWGYPAIVNSYVQMPIEYKWQIQKNYGVANVMKNYADLLFVPQRFRDGFITLSKLFAKNEVFLELAIPTIMFCIADKADVIFLNGIPWATGNAYNPRLDFFHPVKFSSAQNRDAIKSVFDRIINDK
jgi:hypothetical protein